MKIQNFSKGFTLIELLVAMAIIAILSTTTIVFFGKNEDRDMRGEKSRFTTFLRGVQNKALAGEKAGITLGVNEKLCGFGVKMPSSNMAQSYYVKAPDLNSDCALYLNDAGTNYTDAFYFSNDVVASSGFPNTDKLFFLIPNGEIYLNGSQAVGFPKTIILTKGSVTANTIIDLSGRIY